MMSVNRNVPSHSGRQQKSNLRVDVDAERGEVGLQADAGGCQRAREVNETLSGSGHTGRTVDERRQRAVVRFERGGCVVGMGLRRGVR